MVGFIDDHRDLFGVEPICAVLPIAPSTYFLHQAQRRDPTWLLVVDRLRRYGCEGILDDVGCGPGQFAQLCDDWAFESYVGLDFSAVAVEMARA